MKYEFRKLKSETILYLRALDINICRSVNMKTISFIIISILMLSNNLMAQSPQHINAIKFKELTSKAGVIILDVRTPQEFSRGHIKGSTLLDIADREFVNRINLVQKDKTILLYCLTGSRSYAAANYMHSIGFKSIYNLQQGIMDWNRQGFPLEQSTQVVASAGKTHSTETFSALLKENKLVLVDFHAVWCAPCKQMSPVVDKIAVDFKGKAKIEKIDVEANKSITAAYQVQSVPGFVIFKDGKKVWSHTGLISYNDLSLALKKFMS